MGGGNSDFWPCKREGETERERFKIDDDRCSSSSSYLSFLSQSPFIIASRPKLGKKEEKFSGNIEQRLKHRQQRQQHEQQQQQTRQPQHDPPPYSPGLKS